MPILRFGMRMESDIRARLLERSVAEQTFLLTAGGDSAVVRTRIVGDSHIYNCLAAAAAALLHGISLVDIVRGLEAAESLPCRLQHVEFGQDFGVFLDAARTPDRLANALHSVRSAVSGKIYCVLGADGEQSPQNAARLGRVAERFADQSVITSLHCRGKAPLELAHRILDGCDDVHKPLVSPNRKRAIASGVRKARPGDAVLVAGCQPQQPTAEGVVREPREARWCRESLQEDVFPLQRLQRFIPSGGIARRRNCRGAGAARDTSSCNELNDDHGRCH